MSPAEHAAEHAHKAFTLLIQAQSFLAQAMVEALSATNAHTHEEREDS